MFSTGSQPWRAAPPKQVPEALALAEAVLLCHISVFFFLTFWRVMLGVVRRQKSGVFGVNGCFQLCCSLASHSALPECFFYCISKGKVR